MKGMKFDNFIDPMGEWAVKFKPFIESESMTSIYEVLKKDAKKKSFEKPKVVPLHHSVYRAFKTTNPSQLKVVFYLQDPYPRLYKDGIPQATGIAMDCSNTPDGKTLQPSLEYWYDAIDRYLLSKESVTHKANISGEKCLRTPSLTYLHEQGVMMLNTDLTCKTGKTSSHEGLWEPFQKFFLEEIMSYHTGIIYVLCGNSSHNLKKYINPLGNYIFELEHPFAAGHRGDEVWRDNNIFSKINQILISNNGHDSVVFWNKKDWDVVKSLPF